MRKGLWMMACSILTCATVPAAEAWMLVRLVGQDGEIGVLPTIWKEI